MFQVRRIAKWSGIAIAALLAISGLLILDRFSAARQSVDAHDGTLILSGLLDEVEILRDTNKVPHIFGTSETDVSFALGVAHAQDRLWQMELFRRVGQGRLSELLGSLALPADRYIRTLGLYRLAQETLPHLKPETLSILNAYAAGVNAYLGTRKNPLPPEFLFLAHEPEHWSAADSVVMTKLLALGLSGNATRELSRAHLTKVLTPEQLIQFLPPYPGNAPIALPDFADLYAQTPIQQAAASIPDTGPKGASNNWVVDGNWTLSGKPLLANDPHLGMLAPSLWYLAHLAYPDRNVVGATIAGIPSVVLGRNDWIAWGYTNTGPDTQDLYVEKLNPDNANEYLTPTGYTAFDERIETIKVRFGRDETLVVRSTRHGPVLPTTFFGAEKVIPENHVIAFAWTALSGPDLTIQAGHEITRARTFADFKAALRTYTSPMQNMIFANVEGEIGFIAPANIPVRAAENETAGLLPAPGWKTENDWVGLIPYEDLPQSYNPPRGYIVTANNKIVPDSYPYSITRQWDLPFRAIRIEELLLATRDHTVESFSRMQMDNGSSFAERFTSLLLERASDLPQTREPRERLAAWNHMMAGEKPEPLIFAAWMRELTRSVYADELGEQFPRHWNFHATFMEAVLTENQTENQGAQAWCDNIATPAEETCGQAIDQALVKALEHLRATYGDNMKDWRWSTAHPVVNQHIPGSLLPLVGDALSISRPSSGGNHTINRGQHSINAERPFDNIHAAGFRAVYDLNNLNASRYMISTGQSGNPFSSDYDTFASGWATGESITIQTERDEIDVSAQLSLRPTPNPIE